MDLIAVLSLVGTLLVHECAAGAIIGDQIDDLLARLYGLHTLLQLHFLQEEENYFTLTDDDQPENIPAPQQPHPHEPLRR